MVKMGTVWERTAEFLTDNLGTILPISLLAFLVPLSISGNFMQVRDAGHTDFQFFLEVLQLVFSVLAVWGWLTLIALVFEPESGRAGETGVRRLAPALVLWILIGIGITLILLPLELVPAAYGKTAQTAFLSGGSDLPGLAKLFLVVYLPGSVALSVWLIARLIVVSPVVVSEKRIFGAISRSWALTRGMTLRIVGVMLLYFLVVVVAVLATRVVFGSVFELISGSPSTGMSLAHVLTAVMVAAIQTTFTLIAPIFEAKLYLALVQREAATPA